MPRRRTRPAHTTRRPEEGISPTTSPHEQEPTRRATTPRAADDTLAPDGPRESSSGHAAAGAPGDILAPLGYDERVHALFAPLAASGLVPGRVARVDRGGSYVLTADGPERATRAPQLARTARSTGDHGADPADDGLTDPAVGDWVALRLDTGLDHGLIEAILPRSSAFARTDPGRAGAAQVVAANVDSVFLVHSVEREFNPRRLERELVLVWESGARPVVVLNKADLLPDPEARATMRAAAAAVALDTPIHLSSAVTGEGVAELTAYTEGNRTVALLGASGVGKSTLVNRLVGETVQDTGDVREGDSKGRHITVARELVPLPAGGVLVDTPGLRAVGIQDADAGLAATFSDVEELAAGCRFRDCRHEEEPGCAVIAAVEAGALAPDRLASYHKLQRELEFEAAKQDARSRRAHDRRWAPIRKAAREHYKRGRR